MKGKMKSILEDVSTSNAQTTIIVKNIADKTKHTYPLRDKAIEKILLISDHIKEGNKIELTLTLVDNLTVVEDLSAKINGIYIDFADSLKRVKEEQNGPKLNGFEKWLLKTGIKLGIILAITVVVMTIFANAGKWF